MRLARAWLSWEGRIGLSRLARPTSYGWPILAMPQTQNKEPNMQNLAQSRFDHIWMGTKHTL